MPKSGVSRAISRLEKTLAIRLFQRTTREVSLAAAGEALRELPPLPVNLFKLA